MKTYRLSPAGTRQTLILLVAALIIWAFAVWSFASTLRISYNPLQFWSSLQASLAQGLGVGQVVPALIMLVLMIATPLLIWSLLAELSAAYTPTPQGLRLDTIGATVTYPWESLAALHRHDDADEPFDELVVTGAPDAQIASPLVRFLHRQAFGPGRLPVYPGLQQRDELIAEIQRHMAAPAPATAAAPASA